MSTKPLAFIVLGSHRSGTSALTRVLSELGAAAPRELLEPSSDNPDGYYESHRIIQLDNDLLRLAGLRWFHEGPLPEGFFHWRRVRALRRRALRILRDDFDGASALVLKDPRFSRLVPFWADVLEEFGAETHWVLMLRHPAEVARSLERRRHVQALADAAVTAPGQAFLLWLRYTLDAERDTRGRARTILTFDGFLEDWAGAVGRICSRHPGRLAGLEDPESVDRVDELVSPGRRRSRLEAGESLPDAYREAASLYASLSEHVERGAALPEDLLDATRSGLNLAHAAFRPLRRDGEPVRTDDPWGERQLAHTFERARPWPRVEGERAALRVLFLSGAPDSRSLHYRVENHLEALRAHGSRGVALAQSDVPGAQREVEQSDLVILHRAPWNDELAALVARCKDMGVPVGLDTDDLLFLPELMTPDSFDYLGGLDEASRHRWREYAEGLRGTLDATDFAIVSTEPLAAHARRVGAKPFVLPNALGSRDLGRALGARLVRRCPSWGGRIRIGYASGTPTHRRDFERVAGAVARVLEANPSAVFVALGFLDVEDYPALAPHRGRIERRPAVPYARLPRELARFDVNLAPLEEGNSLCEAKSELKYFEAGILGIPTVASGTEVYRSAIADGVNGRLATTSEEWTQALLELVGHKEVRRRLGRAARRHVLGLYGPEATQRHIGCLHGWIRAELSSSAGPR